MTYNFDPDIWYDNEISILKDQLDSKIITRNQFNLDMDILDQRHEEMWNRLNNSYQVLPDQQSQQWMFKPGNT